MTLEAVRRKLARLGVAGTHDVTKKHARPLRVLRALRLVRERVDPTLLALPDGTESRCLSETELFAHAEDPALGLEPAAVRASFARGDRCFGVVERGVLASYGWYASRPAPLGGALHFHFDAAYFAFCNGFTRPEFRGKRLDAIGMARAVASFVDAGAKGVLSCVDADDFASLGARAQAGYEPIGTIVVLTVGDRPRSVVTPGCRPYRVDVQPAAN